MADISLIQNAGHVQLQPATVHGLLWLQTHFETASWPTLCSGRARISATSSETLRHDAEASGLRVSVLRTAL